MSGLVGFLDIAIVPKMLTLLDMQGDDFSLK